MNDTEQERWKIIGKDGHTLGEHTRTVEVGQPLVPSSVRYLALVAMRPSWHRPRWYKSHPLSGGWITSSSFEIATGLGVPAEDTDAWEVANGL